MATRRDRWDRTNSRSTARAAPTRPWGVPRKIAIAAESVKLVFEAVARFDSATLCSPPIEGMISTITTMSEGAAIDELRGDL
jgi:hypothetical protein